MTRMLEQLDARDRPPPPGAGHAHRVEPRRHPGDPRRASAFGPRVDRLVLLAPGRHVRQARRHHAAAARAHRRVAAARAPAVLPLRRGRGADAELRVLRRLLPRTIPSTPVSRSRRWSSRGRATRSVDPADRRARSRRRGRTSPCRCSTTTISWPRACRACGSGIEAFLGLETDDGALVLLCRAVRGGARSRCPARPCVRCRGRRVAQIEPSASASRRSGAAVRDPDDSARDLRRARARRRSSAAAARRPRSRRWRSPSARSRSPTADRHRADGFDLCDQTHCQVCAPRRRRPTRRAGDRRPGAALPGRASRRSSTARRAAAGPRFRPTSGPAPRIRRTCRRADDEACGGAPAWEAELAEADLAARVPRGRLTGATLRDLRVVARNELGPRGAAGARRPDAVAKSPARTCASSSDARSGWQHIKSTAFDLRRPARGYRFSGHGSGHGVGLCVIGSTNLPRVGTSVRGHPREIFPRHHDRAGRPAAAPAARCRPAGRCAAAGGAARRRRRRPHRRRTCRAFSSRCPTTTKGERGAVAASGRAGAGRPGRALGMAAPARIASASTRPTDDYERATGRSWFTLGRVVDGEVHLLPLVVLRERGMSGCGPSGASSSTLMVDPELAGRPAWVRDGAALFSPDPRRGSPVPEIPRGACPAGRRAAAARLIARARSPTRLAARPRRASAPGSIAAHGRSWQQIR